jgi:hypothetical protein
MDSNKTGPASGFQLEFPVSLDPPAPKPPVCRECARDGLKVDLLLLVWPMGEENIVCVDCFAEIHLFGIIKGRWEAGEEIPLPIPSSPE